MALMSIAKERKLQKIANSFMNMKINGNKLTKMTYLRAFYDVCKKIKKRYSVMKTKVKALLYYKMKA